MRNLALNVDDKRLQEIFSTVTGRKVRVKKALIIRSKDRRDSSGRGRSMGYGFVEFINHKDALAALRATNNNPDIFGADRRPIVEFSLENSLVVQGKQRRLDRAQQRQRQGELQHARDEQPKTNKEKRLEKNQKRREKRQRKREARKKKRKLEQAQEGDGDIKPADESDKAKPSKSNKKEEKMMNDNSWKAKKAMKSFPAEMPVPRKLGKNDRQNRKQFSAVRSNVNKSDARTSTINTNSPAGCKLSKVKKGPKERKSISENIQKAVASSIHSNVSVSPGPSDRKRKGARRKEQERKDESNFSEMVNKYKNKLFGKDDSESPAKRSRWFDD